ncbi:AIPR family protein [Sandaracinobacter sp. RS1-74]|uniref:AIPR family protein n=1 Tax=Sandaracinobacteroides sayramensis TaxID=2913411 RepID=UPI001EDB614E|nr:AIPR family protein [Sandaracinobacteroides sayramensis]MCG2840771.1 AIPR family protein [Sandaracinobacteroides sayramensis]
MPIRPEQFAILKRHLEQVYVPHLPKLLQPKSDADDLKKNVDRSFAAFAIDHICRLDPKKAAKAVVDDFDDHGIDAIYYHARTKTLYLAQAKLKDTASFTQAEALTFSQGIRKLLNGDYSGFNANIIARESAISAALDHCDKIEVVIAHTGEGITANAAKAIDDLLADKAGGDARLTDAVLDFDAARTVAGLHSVNAVEPVDCRITLYNHGAATEPKIAYYGTVALSDLSDLHKKHGKALYQKNIRTWLGHNTPVNEAIRETLATNPTRFQYLNNGVTALCEDIAPKSGKGTENRDFELTGFSIINGAQTVASTASFVAENPAADISDAKVMITLIKADAEGDFGKEVTRARNTQNDVKEIAFAALDEEQERVRRELQHLDIEYVYRVGEAVTGFNPNRILVAEAIQALAMLELDPRYPVWMKRSLVDFQKTDGEPYRQIFSQSLSSIRLANAVTVYRYIKQQVSASVRGCLHEERKAYKHSEYALAFVFAKQFREAIGGNALIDAAKLKTAGSAPYDTLRQHLWEVIQSFDWPGPLAISKNQDHTLNVIRRLMVRQYGLKGDPAIKALRAKLIIGQPYQIDFFKYLSSKASQIGNIV